MTNTRHNLGRVTLAVIFVAVLACTVVVRAVAQTPPGISKKELKTLLATAKTPADQERLAAYYRNKAEHLRTKAQEFSAQADYLATQPSAIEGKCTRSFSKQGISCNGMSHYRYFSKLYAQDAKDAEALAAKHDQLAQDFQYKVAQQ